MHRTIVMAGASLLAAMTLPACAAQPTGMAQERPPGIEAQRLSECERAELERVRYLIENPEPPRTGRDVELEQAIALKIIGTPPGEPLWPEKCDE